MSRIVESGVFVSSSFGAEFRLLIGFLFGLLTGVACSVLPAADTGSTSTSVRGMVRASAFNGAGIAKAQALWRSEMNSGPRSCRQSGRREGPGPKDRFVVPRAASRARQARWRAAAMLAE
jgi:hypothetical protein